MTARAEQDVDDVLRWFAEQGAPAAGQRWFTQLMGKIETLEARPERCHRSTEAEEVGIEVRELLFGRRTGRYRILFEITGQTVFILHIRHGARRELQKGDV
jgi:plasmid stabilization system protein ParE